MQMQSTEVLDLLTASARVVSQSRKAVEDALSSILTSPECSIDSPRARKIKESCKMVVVALTSQDPSLPLDEVCEALLDKLKKVIQKSNSKETSAKLERDLLWTNYQQYSISELDSVWSNTIKKVCATPLDPILPHMVNEALFNKLLKEHCREYSTTKITKHHTLSDEEKNALRYACGFVPMRLMKKYAKDDTEKAAQFVECLHSMAIEGPSGSLIEYTTHWITLVNRGGLFEVNDETFQLFCAIEVVLINLLKSQLLAPSSTRDELIKGVTSDDDVLFHWSLVSTTIDCDIPSEELALSSSSEKTKEKHTKRVVFVPTLVIPTKDCCLPLCNTC